MSTDWSGRSRSTRSGTRSSGARSSARSSNARSSTRSSGARSSARSSNARSSTRSNAARRTPLRLSLLALLVALVAGAAIAWSAPAVAADSTAPPVAADQHASVERTGQSLTIAVDASAVEAGDEIDLTVRVPAASAGSDGSTSGAPEPSGESSPAGAARATATRNGSRYVATVPVTRLVGPDVATVLDATTVRLLRDGDVLVERSVDLRVVAARSPPTFRGATLSVDVDARGLGRAANRTVRLAVEGADASPAGTVVGTGPNATVLVAPEELSTLALDGQYDLAVLANGTRIPGATLRLRLLDAASRGTRIAFRGGEPVLAQPLLHPALGPADVEVRVRTRGPAGHFAVSGSDESGSQPVPGELVAADGRSATVLDDGTVLLRDVGVPITPRARPVPLRVADGGLSAPESAALAPYDAVQLRADGVTHVEVGERLRSGEPVPIAADVARDLEASDGSASALLVGADRRPAPANLTVAPDAAPEPAAVPDGPPAPDAEGFVGIWIDVGEGVLLLVVAMVGSLAAAGLAYAVRLVRPAARTGAGLVATVGHFALGGAAGTLAIATAQQLWLAPVLDAIAVDAGPLGVLEVGLGAPLVGVFYGGVVASAVRVGLGSNGLWPTRYGAGRETAPVSVRFTDDAGDPIPGEGTVEVRRPGTGRLLRSATVSGTVVDLELSPGEYGFVGVAGERETDPVTETVPVPERTVADATEVGLSIGRPGFQVEVTDAQTGDPVDGATVAVTTDSEKTKTAAASEGTARVALPVETATATVAVDAEGYERATVEEPVAEQVLTVDVALEPVSGELVATALVDGEPLPDARLEVAPGGEPPPIGVRTATLRTDEDGRARTELPVGDYGVRLVLEGPNAEYFEHSPTAATVEAVDPAASTVDARFGWTPPDRLRRRASSVEDTIRKVAMQSTVDPTIPLYFAGVAGELLDVFHALPDAGHRFATSPVDPGAVAVATIDGAGATLSAVGTAMGADAVRPVLATDREPERVTPDLDASPGALVDYLARDLTIATVEERAERVADRVDDAADDLATVAPARAVVAAARQLRGSEEGSTKGAGREYAALLLLDAVEGMFGVPAIRTRLAEASAVEE